MAPIQSLIRLLSGNSQEADDSQWYCLRMPAAQVKRCEHEAVIAQFHIDYVAADRPRGMALWLARNKGGSATIFFSPQSTLVCSTLLVGYRARPCMAPMRPMVLIAGDYSCSPVQPGGWSEGAVDAPLTRYSQAPSESDHQRVSALLLGTKGQA